MTDPKLLADGAEGQLREEIEMIVDGIVEDIRHGKIATRFAARSRTCAATQMSVYSVDFDRALEVLKLADERTKRDVCDIARKLLWIETAKVLEASPDYAALPHIL